MSGLFRLLHDMDEKKHESETMKFRTEFSHDIPPDGSFPPAVTWVEITLPNFEQQCACGAKKTPDNKFLLVCSQCDNDYYCSKKCQQDHLLRCNKK